MKLNRLHYIFIVPTIIACTAILFFLKYTSHSTTSSKEIASADLETYLRYEVKTVASVRDVWIPYYHRHKQVHEAMDAMELLVDQDTLTAEEEYFFSILARENTKFRKQLTTKRTYLDKEKKEAITKALDAEKSEPISSAEIWAQYAYTGDLSVVDSYLKRLTQPDIDDNTKRIITENIIEKSYIYYPIYLHIAEIVRSRSSDLSSKLFTINKTITDRAYTPSSTFIYRAKNHFKAEEYQEAFTSLQTSHTFYKDNPYLYYTFGEIVKQSDPLKAIDAYKRANWLYTEHSDKVVHFRIAETYDKIGDLKNTVYHYEQALKLDPDYISALVNLTYACFRTGNHAKTIEYATQVIKKDEDERNIIWAREILEELEADVSIADRRLIEIQNNPKNLINKEQFQKLENLLSETDRLKTSNENGDLEIYSLYEKFIPGTRAKDWQFQQLVPKISKWVTQHPDSHFANAGAGFFYLNYAWNGRGVGYSSSITKRSSELFHERMKIAGKYLGKAYKQLPSDSSVPCKMISVAKINPAYADNLSVDEWYNLAVEAYASDPKPYHLRWFYLAPKWGGTRELQFDFARSVFSNAPNTSSASQILPITHWHIYREKDDIHYFRNKEVWEEISQVYTQITNAFPDSMKYHNLYAKVAYYADQFEVARKEFLIIGDKWDKGLWVTKEKFEEAHKGAFQEISKYQSAM